MSDAGMSDAAMSGAGTNGGGAAGPTVAVVGGGIAGLAAAWELSDHHGVGRVVVLEATDRLGGKIVTGDFAGRRVDLGPDAFVARRPEAVELCQELGLGDDLVAPGVQGAGLWNDGRMHRLPEGLALGVPTRLGPLARSGIVSPRGLGQVVADLATPPWRAPATLKEDEAIGPLLAARLGREIVDKLADPLIGGIHAGSVESMSAAAVFPPLLEAAARPGSLARNLRSAVPPGAQTTPGAPDATPVFLTVRRGLSRLVDTLARRLSERGVELRTGEAVKRLTRRHGGWCLDAGHGELEADAVVLALPAPAAATLVHEVDAGLELARLLAAVSYATVSLVTMRFAASDVRAGLAGTGFLVPRTSGGLVTACTFLSAKWPELARPDDVLVRVSAGRFGDIRAEGLDDDDLVARATEELTPALGLTGPPTQWTVTRFAESFPQYDVGHLQRVGTMEQTAARAGALALAGAALRGVGIPACIASGRRAARLALAGIGSAPGR